MYAVIRAGGRQQRVALGEVVRIDKQDAEVGQTLQIKDVLMVQADGKTTVGKPVVADSFVEGKVVRQGRGKKIRVYTYKRRTGYSKTRGHRQNYTDLLIRRISVAGEDLVPLATAAGAAEASEPQA